MENNISYPNFLNIESKTGTIIQSIDWKDHPLGHIDEWPVSLRVTLGIILNSNYPEFLFWGPDNICFYNDSFIPILKDNNQNPDVMGQRAAYLWSDEWDFVRYQINKVKQSGKAFWITNQSIPIFFRDELRQSHYRFYLSPVIDDNNSIQGVLVTGKTPSATSQKNARRYKKSTGPSHIIEYFNEGFLAIDYHWVITDLNNLAEKLFNAGRNEIIGKTIWEINPETLKNEYLGVFERTMIEKQTASFRTYSETYNSWFDILISPTANGIIIHFFDITEQQRQEMINQRTEEISGVAGWEYDVATKSIFMTPKAYEIYGLPKGTFIDLEINTKLFDKKSLNLINKALDRAINKKESYELELNLKQQDGTKKTVRITGFPLVDNEKTRKLYGTIKDVTRQKQKQQERDDIIKRLKMSQKIAKIGYWRHNIRENKSEWSEELYHIWEKDPASFKPNLENLIKTIHPNDRDMFKQNIDTLFPGQDFYDSEHRIITPAGKLKWILERVTLHRDKKGTPKWMEGIAQDITEKKEQEQEILNALREKEVLLAEVHHRVKNNLAVISGMMQLQAYDEESEVLKTKLMDSVVRIISMASIHEQLYQSGSFSKLEFSDNLESLVRKIVDAMQTNIPISLKFQLKETQLNVNQAIPFSLIVNEVVTNIIKYAFTGKRKGAIWFTLFEKNDVIKLEIKDNGIGLPQNFETNKKKTLGLRLISILAKQLEAAYQYKSSDTGTTFSIQFERSEAKGTGNAHM